VQWLERFIAENAIDVLALTPLLGFHHVNPLRDFDMQTVAGEVFGSIAVRTRCAIEIGNRLNKKEDEASGAPALLHAMHVVRTVTTMTAGAADRFGIAVRDRDHYVKIESKTGPIVVEEAWFRLDGDCDLVAVSVAPASGDHDWQGDNSTILSVIDGRAAQDGGKRP